MAARPAHQRSVSYDGNGQHCQPEQETKVLGHGPAENSFLL